jgi:hypothetical protein
VALGEKFRGELTTEDTENTEGRMREKHGILLSI